MLQMSFSGKLKNIMLQYLRFVFTKTIGFKWRKYMSFRKWFPAKKPFSLYKFIVYYLRFLLIFGLRSATRTEDEKMKNFSSSVTNYFDLSGFIKPFIKAFIK